MKKGMKGLLKQAKKEMKKTSDVEKDIAYPEPKFRLTIEEAENGYIVSTGYDRANFVAEGKDEVLSIVDELL